jgi:hypothetical protein
MQPDNPHVSCCGEADAFEADTFEADGDHYVAIITDGKGVLPPGTRIEVPNQKMKWDTPGQFPQLCKRTGAADPC